MMDTFNRFCDAVSFLLMGAAITGFCTLCFFAQGGELRLPAGNMPKDLLGVEEGYSTHDRHALEAKYRKLFAELKQ